MTFEAVARRDLGDLVASELRAAILRGDYQAGDSLPSESALAMQFGVNRTTLRDALRELEHLGLIDRRQGARARVLDWHRTGSIALLRHLIESGFGGEEFDSQSLEALSNVLESFFGVVADAIVDGEKPVGLLTSHLGRLRRAAEDHDVASAEVEIRGFCDSFVDAADSLVLRLLWNSFGHIFEVDLDPDMKVVHAVAVDVATRAEAIETLESLTKALMAHDRRTSQSALDELFTYLKSLIYDYDSVPGVIR